MERLKFVFDNYYSIIGALAAVLGGLITIFLLIPGDQPEKALQRVVDFLARISKK